MKRLFIMAVLALALLGGCVSSNIAKFETNGYQYATTITQHQECISGELMARKQAKRLTTSQEQLANLLLAKSPSVKITAQIDQTAIIEWSPTVTLEFITCYNGMLDTLMGLNDAQKGAADAMQGIQNAAQKIVPEAAAIIK